eukprot:TRINITY_DN104822_c0_g1_i1.p1 TRINITY_DN104822_c0_g1~~TRINITY_DN104822_c0_g1_i1.p1  ORF type:complete len:320 (+),score=28.21 TRINITY_DN104822_c0_g1_i1:74-961(+)
MAYHSTAHAGAHDYHAAYGYASQAAHHAPTAYMHSPLAHGHVPIQYIDKTHRGGHDGHSGNDPDAGRNRFTYHDEKAWVGKMQLVPQPGPSPLQQWIREAPPPELPEYTVGHPVRLCHLIAPGSTVFNKLVGDIIHVMKASDGSLIFCIRVPLYPAITHSKNLQHRPDHFKIKVSHWARQAAVENRKKVAHLYGVPAHIVEEYEEDPYGIMPPFIIFDGLTSEKIDPIGICESSAEGRGHAWVRPPVWGPPLTQQEFAAYRAQGKIDSGMGIYDMAPKHLSRHPAGASQLPVHHP